MITIQCFTFNPFQENSYILYDESGECVVIDPGCSSDQEQSELAEFIAAHELSPVRLLNTHCHIDHVLGNRFVADNYGLALEIHEKDCPTLEMACISAELYTIPYDESPAPEKFISESDFIKFGNSELAVLFLPGHAPGHIAFVSDDQKFVIGGDVLFRGSIGRTDLPGGNHETLIDSIKSTLFAVGDDYAVYPGHGPATTIGYEKENNPFF